MSAVERPYDTPKLVTCRTEGCGEPLATIGKQGGVYPLPGVRVYIERGRVIMFCPCCEAKRRWPLAQAA